MDRGSLKKTAAFLLALTLIFAQSARATVLEGIDLLPTAEDDTEASAGGADAGASQERAADRETSAEGTEKEPGPEDEADGQEDEPESRGEPGQSEAETEKESGKAAGKADSRRPGIPVLADTNGDTEVRLYAPGGHFFPVGTVFRLLDIADMVGDVPDRDERCKELEETLRSAWKEGLQGERAFLPYYLMVTDSAGNELTVPEKMDIHIIIRDPAFYSDACTRTDVYRVACQGNGGEFIEAARTEILRDDVEQSVTISTETEKTGWISILQTEAVELGGVERAQEEIAAGTEPAPEAPEESGTGSTPEISEEPWTEWTTELFEEPGTGSMPEMPEEPGTGSAPEMPEEPGTEWTTELSEEPGTGSMPELPEEPWTEWMTELSEEPGTEWTTELFEEYGTEYDAEPPDETESQTEAPFQEELGFAGDFGFSLMALEPTGNSVTSSGSGFVKMDPSQLDGAYRSARWYEGISSFSTFNNAGASVQTMMLNQDSNIFYPLDDNGKGKFGGIYKKILYEDGVWYDLKITVVDYTNQICAGAAGEMVPSYSPIGFCNNAIKIRFKCNMGESLLKMEYYKNGDASQTPVRVNTRFQWWEIDNSQRFGIRAADGSIKAKYYQVEDSIVHYQMQTAAVDGQSYLVLTAAENINSTDKRGNIGLALSDCSTYYVLIGQKDQIETNPEARATKANIVRWNEALRSGTTEGVQLGILTQSDVDVPIPPDKTYPQKAVSNDSASWSSANVLSKVDAEYYYRIRQYVPWETPANYFSQFQITDHLPAGVDYVGNLTVRRAEDNRDVSAQFESHVEKDTVTVEAKDAFLADSGMYGFTFDIIFKVRMDVQEISAQQQGSAASYHVSNKASAQMTFAGSGDAYDSESNTVDTTVSIEKQTQKDPVKRLDANESLTEKTLSSVKDAIVFSIYQEIPENDDVLRPTQVAFTDTLADCLEYQSAQVYQKEGGSYVRSDGWTAEASGQKITVSKKFRPSGQTFRLDITCNVREGFDMQAYTQTIDSRHWYVIPNTAEVELFWESGSPPSVKKQTNEARVKINAGPVQAHLTLTKEIAAADIVWAHGNPTFTFRVSGEDLDGKTHTYYQTVEFQKENVSGGEKVSLSAEFDLPAGWYTATEEETIRYALNSIYSVVGGSASGDKAVFDLSGGGEGYATFYNVKTTDEGESHSAFVRNVISK